MCGACAGTVRGGKARVMSLRHLPEAHGLAKKRTLVNVSCVPSALRTAVPHSPRPCAGRNLTTRPVPDFVDPDCYRTFPTPACTVRRLEISLSRARVPHHTKRPRPPLTRGVVGGRGGRKARRRAGRDNRGAVKPPAAR
eukprot:gene14399-biopygen18631